MANPIVEVQNVKKSYRMGEGQLWALKGVTFTIEEGEFVALVGRSGSGKTTLLNLLGGLDQPTSGNLSISGTELAKLDDNALTLFRGQKIGYVFQTFNLIPVFSALENVEYPLIHQKHISPQRRKEMAAQSLEQVGLKDFIHQRPSHLSGGQRQRVAIARALVHAPSLIMADEPTANLDSMTAIEILELMFELNRTLKRTFVVASHDQTVIQRAKRIVELTDGVIKK